MGEARRKAILEWIKKEHEDELVGLVKCEYCDGKGFIVTTDVKIPNFRYLEHCERCKGVGKITWLKNIFKCG